MRSFEDRSAINGHGSGGLSGTGPAPGAASRVWIAVSVVAILVVAAIGVAVMRSGDGPGPASDAVVGRRIAVLGTDGSQVGWAHSPSTALEDGAALYEAEQHPTGGVAVFDDAGKLIGRLAGNFVADGDTRPVPSATLMDGTPVSSGP